MDTSLRQGSKGGRNIQTKRCLRNSARFTSRFTSCTTRLSHHAARNGICSLLFSRSKGEELGDSSYQPLDSNGALPQEVALVQAHHCIRMGTSGQGTIFPHHRVAKLHALEELSLASTLHLPPSHAELV